MDHASDTEDPAVQQGPQASRRRTEASNDTDDGGTAQQAPHSLHPVPLSQPPSSLPDPADAGPDAEVPMATRQATRIYESRADVRDRIANSSPNLQHSERWLETLLSVREYKPPEIWWLVNLITTAITVHSYHSVNH
jgi:hypothetical protein